MSLKELRVKEVRIRGEFKTNFDPVDKVVGFLKRGGKGGAVKK